MTLYVLPATGSCTSCGAPATVKLVDLDFGADDESSCAPCACQRSERLIAAYTLPPDWRTS